MKGCGAGHQAIERPFSKRPPRKQKAMTRRQEFSRRTRLDTWERAGGCCEGCGRKLYPGDRQEYDHRISCEQGGDNSPANCELLCGWCHDGKTAVDARKAAKSRSVRAKHVGAAKPRKPLPGSRASGWKRKIDGTVERRE